MLTSAAGNNLSWQRKHGEIAVEAMDASLILGNYVAAATNQPLLFDEAQLELADTNGDGNAGCS